MTHNHDGGELSKRAGSLSLAEILLHAIYNAPAFMDQKLRAE